MIVVRSVSYCSSMHPRATNPHAALLQLILWVKWNFFASICISICTGLLLIRAAWLLSSLSNNIGGLLNFGDKAFVALLNSSVNRLAKLGLIGVALICNTAICKLVLVLKHFFIIHFTNFAYDSDCSDDYMMIALHDGFLHVWKNLGLQQFLPSTGHLM